MLTRVKVMSHQVELPDELYDEIRQIADANGTTDIDVIHSAIAQIDPQAKSDPVNSARPDAPKSLWEQLRPTIRFVSGRAGTENLSGQRFEMSDDDIQRIMGR